jgi:hypothetical protein
VLLFPRRYCSGHPYCSPIFGSTIACTSISRASAGSLYPSFGFNINLLSSLSFSLILLLLTLLIALIRHVGAWWCAITSPESAHRYHRVAQTQTLGEAPLDPSLGPGPSRAVTQTQQPDVDLPEADPTAETPDERADGPEQAEEDDYVIPSPLTPLGSLPHPQQPPPRLQQPLLRFQPPPAPRKPKLAPAPHAEPPRRSEQIAKLTETRQPASGASNTGGNM